MYICYIKINKGDYIVVDTYCEEYMKLTDKLIKAGWKQILGDADPYSNITKKFIRLNFHTLPDVIEINFWTGIMDARIGGKKYLNFEMESIGQLEQIIRINHGFEICIKKS